MTQKTFNSQKKEKEERKRRKKKKKKIKRKLIKIAIGILHKEVNLARQVLNHFELYHIPNFLHVTHSFRLFDQFFVLFRDIFFSLKT